MCETFLAHTQNGQLTDHEKICFAKFDKKNDGQPAEPHSCVHREQQWMDVDVSLQKVTYWLIQYAYFIMNDPESTKIYELI